MEPFPSGGRASPTMTAGCSAAFLRAHRGWEDVDWRDFRLEAEKLGVTLARAGDVPFREARLESMSNGT